MRRLKKQETRLRWQRFDEQCLYWQSHVVLKSAMMKKRGERNRARARYYGGRKERNSGRMRGEQREAEDERKRGMYKREREDGKEKRKNEKEEERERERIRRRGRKGK